MLAEGFLAEHPEPTRAQVREVVSSNYCRCTGYQSIVDSVEACARQRRSCGVKEGNQQ